MSYVDSQLLPGESIVYRSRLHWKVFLAPGFFSVLLTVCAIGLIARHANEAAAFVLFAAAALFVPSFLKRANSEFAVTNKRLIVKLGFFTTRTLELLLPKVETISVNQTMLGKMLGFGDITVTGSGGTKEQFDGVSSPLELRRAVQAAVQ